MANQLSNESSPYLLQHASNPVDWYPWNEQSLVRAKELDRPIFLSIGYAACHWCHVMEHESFENEAIAKLLNENFVSIKVDREERPDIDMIYMDAVMALRNGQGGWPLSAFLTPSQQVFFGGTYWPPTARMGMPGFDQVLLSVLEAYRNKREAIESQSQEITRWLNRDAEVSASEDVSLDQILQRSVQAMENSCDFERGGFGDAPKFPHAMDLRLLNQMIDDWPVQGSPTREVVATMIDVSLKKMALGGIYDHLGGGFARYSVDPYWLVPHFEKMLYDNALLTTAYTERCQREPNPYFEHVVADTIEYVLRMLTHSDGGFFSTEDADSEGEEGKFYVWSKSETESILGAEAAEFCQVFDVSEAGNFEGHNILNLTDSMSDQPFEQVVATIEKFKSARKQLFDVQAKRIRPGLDDKVITSWNGLMIGAMARAGAVFDKPRWVEAASGAADFVFKTLTSGDRLLHSWRDGTSSVGGFLDDYAAMLCATLELYRATFDVRWIDKANGLAEQMLELFHDAENGGFFFAAKDSEQLIAQKKPFSDNSVPSGNALAACGLLELGLLLNNQAWIDHADRTLQCAGSLLTRAPQAASQTLIAVRRKQAKRQEILLAGRESEIAPLVKQLQQSWLPDATLIVVTDWDAIQGSVLADAIADKKTDLSNPTLYICEGFQCQLPVVGLPEIGDAISKLSK